MRATPLPIPGPEHSIMATRKSQTKREREATAEPTPEQAGVQQFPAESSRARVWQLHLRGMSKVRIAAAVGLNRETVAKIIQQCYRDIAPERKISPARKLDAAVARWRLVQEQAWADHDADDERERQVLALGEQPSDGKDARPSNVTVRFQSQRSQYLRIILDAEKEIARLEGLYENILDVDGAVGFVVVKRDPASQSDSSSDSLRGQSGQIALSARLAGIPAPGGHPDNTDDDGKVGDLL